MTFNVKHFSLYKVLFDIADHVVPDRVKILTSSCMSRFTFQTNLTAFMTDLNDQHFGLCIVGSRTLLPCKVIQQQYPLKVGSCTPRKVKSGKLAIK